MKPASLSDYRELVGRRLPHFLFEYIDGGAIDEVTMASNRDQLLQVALRQRVLRDVSEIRTDATRFGRRQRLSVGLGPIGLAGINARRGEVQPARAAEAAGIPFTLSAVSACGLEEVAGAVTQPL